MLNCQRSPSRVTGRHLTAVGICVTSVMLVAAGCGSATTKTVTVQTAAPAASAKPPPTKVQFIAQAESICRGANSKLAQIIRSVDELKGSTQATASKRLPPLILEAVTIERAEISKLRSLAEPLGETAIVKKYLTANEEKETDETNLAHALENEELNSIAPAEQAAKTARTREHGLAQGYGIECGGPE